MMYTRSFGKTNGFTLLELLVVLVILATLCGIAFPVLSRARSRADRAGCLANVRQIGVAFSAYTDDWDGAYPAAWNEWNTPRYADSGPYPIHTPGIVETVSRYGARPEIWRCPSDTGLNLHFT